MRWPLVGLPVNAGDGLEGLGAHGSSNPFALNLDLDKDFSKFTPKLALSWTYLRLWLTFPDGCIIVAPRC